MRKLIGIVAAGVIALVGCRDSGTDGIGERYGEGTGGSGFRGSEANPFESEVPPEEMGEGIGGSGMEGIGGSGMEGTVGSGVPGADLAEWEQLYMSEDDPPEDEHEHQ